MEVRPLPLHAGDVIDLSANPQDIAEAHAGDICALFGVECASGDTFVSSSEALQYTMVRTCA